MAPNNNDDPQLQILESLVTYKVMQVADTILRAAGQVYRSRYDISITDLRILATIGAHSPLAANDVSRLTRIDKAWVSRSLAALVERKLVSRQNHADDSRIILLSLTPKGRALVRRIIPLAVARHERLLAGLNQRKRSLLNALLDILQVHADDMLARPGSATHGKSAAKRPSLKAALPKR